MFDPAATNGLEDAVLYLGLDAVEESGVEGFEPGILLGLRTGEAMFRVAIHEVALVSPGSRDFSFCFCERP